MVTQIMVPVDGSDAAERALPHAEQLALATGATLHVVRVVDVAVTWVPGSSFAPAYLLYGAHIAAEMAAAAAYLETLHERLTRAGVRIRMERLTGYTAAALLEYERDMGIDLVVMCSHGRSGRTRFAYGSVAARLLRHGAAPVLLVRAAGTPPALEQLAGHEGAASNSPTGHLRSMRSMGIVAPLPWRQHALWRWRQHALWRSCRMPGRQNPPRATCRGSTVACGTPWTNWPRCTGVRAWLRATRPLVVPHRSPCA